MAPHSGQTPEYVHLVSVREQSEGKKEKMSQFVWQIITLHAYLKIQPFRQIQNGNLGLSVNTQLNDTFYSFFNARFILVRVMVVNRLFYEKVKNLHCSMFF